MLSKIERRKIALRNLRKAWAAKREKMPKRKNIRRPAPHPIMNVEVKKSLYAACERYGSAPIVFVAGLWSLLNARDLSGAGYAMDAVAYRIWGNKLIAMARKNKGL